MNSTNNNMSFLTSRCTGVGQRCDARRPEKADRRPELQVFGVVQRKQQRRILAVALGLGCDAEDPQRDLHVLAVQGLHRLLQGLSRELEPAAVTHVLAHGRRAVEHEQNVRSVAGPSVVARRHHLQRRRLVVQLDVELDVSVDLAILEPTFDDDAVLAIETADVVTPGLEVDNGAPGCGADRVAPVAPAVDREPGLGQATSAAPGSDRQRPRRAVGPW